MAVKGWLFPVGLVSLAVVLSGCMTLSDGRQLEEQVAHLEHRQDELETEAEEREEQMVQMAAELAEEIEELEQVLEEARRLLATDSADLAAELAATRRELDRLRGQLEEVEFRHRRFAESFDTFRRDMDRRFEGVEAADLLERAEEFRAEGDLDLARRALEHFLSEYEDHDLVWEARLELGEVYFDSGQWHNATAQYRELLDDPRSEARQARAARRLGEIFVAEERCDQAQIFFEIVVEDYPNSDDAADARRMLRQIERGQCP